MWENLKCFYKSAIFMQSLNYIHKVEEMSAWSLILLRDS